VVPSGQEQQWLVLPRLAEMAPVGLPELLALVLALELPAASPRPEQTAGPMQ
jgi:hypothetical protein